MIADNSVIVAILLGEDDVQALLESLGKSTLDRYCCIAIVHSWSSGIFHLPANRLMQAAKLSA